MARFPANVLTLKFPSGKKWEGKLDWTSASALATRCKWSYIAELLIFIDISIVIYPIRTSVANTPNSSLDLKQGDGA